jgi:hypothetical protein
MWYRIIFIGGIAALAVSLLLLKRSVSFVSRSEQAVGFVTKFDTITGGDAGTTYVPVFSLRTNDGRSMVYQHHSSSAPPAWDIGEKAMFLYDPEDPSSIRMYNYFGVLSWSIVLLTLAILLITYSGGYFLLRRHWR